MKALIKKMLHEIGLDLRRYKPQSSPLFRLSRALEHFGIRKIMILNKKPLYKVVEDAAEKTKKAAILTDLDAEGKKLFGKLNSGLIHHGVKVDKKFREFLFKDTKLRQIEGLRRYVGKLAKL